MKLTNLHNTLLTCIDYHEAKGNETRVNQLKEQLERVNNNHLVSTDRNVNGLYLGQSKTDV